MPAPWLWVAFTLLAATAQTFRNAAQRGLTGSLGTVGATHVRFLFGLPFGLIALAVVAVVAGPVPQPNATFLTWTAFGAVSQIAATALMLAAMRLRSFVVTVAYTKTEPVQVAVFAAVFLGEAVPLAMAIAIIVATAGVLILSWPSARNGAGGAWQPAILGVASGGLFALSAVGFRGGIVALDTPDFVPAATLTLATGLLLQTVLLTAFLLWRQRAVLGAIAKAWRPSLAAGFLGAFASEMWFLAFALTDTARVRTLGLVEILIAGLVSRRYFTETPSRSDILGMVLVVGGIGLLLAPEWG